MEELTWALYGFGFVVYAIIFLLVAKEIFDLVSPYRLNVQLSEKDNPAVGIVLTGYLLGVIAVLGGVFSGDSSGELTLSRFLVDLGPVALYSLVGVVLLLVSGLINDYVILRHFRNTTEIVEKRNVGVAVIVAAGYIGSGLIVAGGIFGSVDLLTAVIAFGVGQAALVLFAFVYQVATSYDDQKELSEAKNTAVGIAFGGNILAFSLIIMQGLLMSGGQLDAWADRARHFGYYAVAGIILLPLLRVVNDKLFLPGVKLADEIVKDRNLNAGLLEAGLAISTGLILILAM